MEMRWLGNRRGGHEKPNLTPAEIDKLITSNTSEASLLRYQEEIASRVAHDVSGEVTRQAKEYERHLAIGGLPPRQIVAVLRDVADIIESSRYPSHVIHIDR